METYKKINEYEIEVTKEVPIVEPTKIIINYEQKEFYEKQILDITAQRDGMIAEMQSLKEQEIAECLSRIKAITDNAIITKPDPIQEVIEPILV